MRAGRKTRTLKANRHDADARRPLMNSQPILPAFATLDTVPKAQMAQVLMKPMAILGASE